MRICKSRSYPRTRQRRIRSSSWIRSLVQEHNLQASDLILPVFITYAQESSQTSKMPGLSKYCVNDAVELIKKADSLGINAVILFPEIEDFKKSNNAKESYNENNILNSTIKKIKSINLEIGIIADVALDPYTIDGHDGITNKKKEVLNDLSIEIMCKQALSIVESGADGIAPSDMMDGRISVIRDHLDSNGHNNKLIFSYGSKLCSSLYLPFRNAIGTNKFKTPTEKNTYQIGITNFKESMDCIARDIDEGSDCIIIKPAITCLDIISASSKSFNVPIFAYMVSGEYAMTQHYDSMYENGVKSQIEFLLSIKRSGARAIITYNAIEIAQYLNGK